MRRTRNNQPNTPAKIPLFDTMTTKDLLFLEVVTSFDLGEGKNVNYCGGDGSAVKGDETIVQFNQLSFDNGKLGGGGSCEH